MLSHDLFTQCKLVGIHIWSHGRLISTTWDGPTMTEGMYTHKVTFVFQTCQVNWSNLVCSQGEGVGDWGRGHSTSRSMGPETNGQTFKVPSYFFVNIQAETSPLGLLSTPEKIYVHNNSSVLRVHTELGLHRGYGQPHPNFYSCSPSSYTMVQGTKETLLVLHFI